MAPVDYHESQYILTSLNRQQYFLLYFRNVVKQQWKFFVSTNGSQICKVQGLIVNSKIQNKQRIKFKISKPFDCYKLDCDQNQIQLISSARLFDFIQLWKSNRGGPKFSTTKIFKRRHLYFLQFQFFAILPTKYKFAQKRYILYRHQSKEIFNIFCRYEHLRTFIDLYNR